MTEAERIAAGLSEAQKAAIPKLIGAWTLPAGHNAWPLVEYDDVCNVHWCAGLVLSEMEFERN